MSKIYLYQEYTTYYDSLGDSWSNRSNLFLSDCEDVDRLYQKKLDKVNEFLEKNPEVDPDDEICDAGLLDFHHVPSDCESYTFVKDSVNLGEITEEEINVMIKFKLLNRRIVE